MFRLGKDKEMKPDVEFVCDEFGKVIRDVCQCCEGTGFVNITGGIDGCTGADPCYECDIDGKIPRKRTKPVTREVIVNEKELIF